MNGHQWMDVHPSTSVQSMDKSLYREVYGQMEVGDGNATNGVVDAMVL
jgi:hypothetical protein